VKLLVKHKNPKYRYSVPVSTWSRLIDVQKPKQLFVLNKLDIEDSLEDFDFMI